MNKASINEYWKWKVRFLFSFTTFWIFSQLAFLVVGGPELLILTVYMNIIYIRIMKIRFFKIVRYSFAH